MTTKEWIKKWEQMLDPYLPVKFTTNSYNCDVIFVINKPHTTDMQFVSENKYKTIIYLHVKQNSLNNIWEYGYIKMY